MTAEPSLAVWIHARLDEDELRARQATPGPWRAHTADPAGEVYSASRRPDSCGWGSEVAACSIASESQIGGIRLSDTILIAHDDPVHALIDVAVKRRIAAEHSPANLKDDHWERTDPRPVCTRCSGTRNSPTFYPYQTVRLCALPYAGHDGWHEKWRPE